MGGGGTGLLTGMTPVAKRMCLMFVAAYRWNGLELTVVAVSSTGFSRLSVRSPHMVVFSLFMSIFLAVFA